MEEIRRRKAEVEHQEQRELQRNYARTVIKGSIIAGIVVGILVFAIFRHPTLESTTKNPVLSAAEKKVAISIEPVKQEKRKDSAQDPNGKKGIPSGVLEPATGSKLIPDKLVNVPKVEPKVGTNESEPEQLLVNQKDEAGAQLTLEIAKDHIKNGRWSQARSKLQMLISKYPRTKTADEAKRLLPTIPDE